MLEETSRWPQANPLLKARSAMKSNWNCLRLYPVRMGQDIQGLPELSCSKLQHDTPKNITLEKKKKKKMNF